MHSNKIVLVQVVKIDIHVRHTVGKLSLVIDIHLTIFYTG